ncbi:biotin/lipoyl-containing protein [Aeromicrobium sp. REDSEA-S32_B7]|uniref:biotin/lipoyl-containing protein n=1 Tax=Aeromicrobium sp. REDSEA-S32_B7 TaxID=1811526 RepID=UPI0029549CEF|nr:biotin/lipoyl-containing protein [Aeromicrobium sp. REDSEA-S32_B7]
MSEFRLPDVGEGLTEAEVLTWHVAVGDVVEVNQTIVEGRRGRSSPTTRRRWSRPTSRRTTRGRRTRRPGRSASRCWSATACAPPRRAAVGARATRPCRPLHRPVG